MNTLYLHIGTPKTGTTALQFFLHKNNKHLKKSGFCYPDFGFRFAGIGKNRNAHWYLGKVYDENRKRDKEQEQKIREEGLKKLEALFSRYPNVILSDEHFWNAPTMERSEWEQLHEEIEAMGAKLKVIVYLRRQDQVIQSYWAQQVKEGKAKEPFEKYIRKGKYNKFRLHYAEQLKMLAEILGKENVIVRCYEKQQYEGETGDIYSDFLHIFGIDLTEEFKDKEKVRNLSLQNDYLEIRRIFNQEDSCKKNTSLSRILLKEQMEEEEKDASSVQGSPYFSGQERIDFLRQFKEDNEIVAREFLGRFDGVLFYDEIRDADQEKVPYDPERLVRICGRIIAKQAEAIEMLEKENFESEPWFSMAHLKETVKKVRGNR